MMETNYEEQVRLANAAAHKVAGLPGMIAWAWITRTQFGTEANCTSTQTLVGGVSVGAVRAIGGHSAGPGRAVVAQYVVNGYCVGSMTLTRRTVSGKQAAAIRSAIVAAGIPVE